MSNPLGSIDWDAPVSPATRVYHCGRMGCSNELIELNDGGLSCEVCGANFAAPDGSGHAPYLGDVDGDEEEETTSSTEPDLIDDDGRLWTWDTDARVYYAPDWGLEFDSRAEVEEVYGIVDVVDKSSAAEPGGTEQRR